MKNKIVALVLLLSGCVSSPPIATSVGNKPKGLAGTWRLVSYSCGEAATELEDLNPWNLPIKDNLVRTLLTLKNDGEAFTETRVQKNVDDFTSVCTIYVTEKVESDSTTISLSESRLSRMGSGKYQ